MNETEHKAEIRAQMRATLQAMDDATKHDFSVRACQRLLELDELTHATVVMLFMPLSTEVDLTPAAVRCFRLGKTVCVPRVNWEKCDMSPVEVTSFDDHVMETDEHGLRFPRNAGPILPQLIDIVIVPGLAFDDCGHRLGRGGGFYDRFLGRIRQTATTVGLAFDQQVIPQVPVEAHDLPLDMVVTERRVMRAGTRARRG
ncbi:MAG: 5-formyltetrahydrofolate cyclo-ligase [Planctomycetota bacterium]